MGDILRYNATHVVLTFWSKANSQNGLTELYKSVTFVITCASSGPENTPDWWIQRNNRKKRSLVLSRLSVLEITNITHVHVQYPGTVRKGLLVEDINTLMSCKSTIEFASDHCVSQ
uniref:AlNc14C171G8001 protein n=1 Tax=Albugo laibachii Nc14 TaxID=890382 RepID=F0WEI5_9STRA|nr:AlNc14C75G5037 [Albugo laibachii Nc14]CCA22868.1 AlNc14C171G8001 [Albugo laibachii Nc14]|eukprot:CCA22868.1 AlNc14C171G8001 [Albugo laibachii Nc14]